MDGLKGILAGRRVLARALGYLRPYLRWQFLGLFITVISAAAGLVQPWVNRILIDLVLLEGNIPLLKTVVLLFAGAVLLQTVTGMAGTYLFTWMSNRAANDLRSALHRKIQLLSVAFAERRKTGDIMSCFTSDVPVVQGLYSSIFVNLLTEAVRFAVVLAVMLGINPRLTLIALPSIPVFAALLALAGGIIKRASRDVQERRADFNALLQEQLAGLRTSAAYGLEASQTREFSGSMTTLLSSQLRLTLKGFIFNAGSLVAMASMILVLYLGGLEVIHGRMQLGVLIAFSGYFGMLFGPVGSFAGAAGQVLQAVGAGERVLGILDTPETVRESPGAAALKDPSGLIEFRDVRFAYPGGNLVLDGLSFRVEPGETVALAGESGAGKTTMVSLLLRFHDPDGGEILLDGRPLRDYTLSTLRENMGVVLQEPFLFGGTIMDNILLGRPGASAQEVEAAARAAHAHRFITGLPEGYKAQTGERGVLLSGGQRQRIALARVFLRNPRVVILDEATSALDRESEEHVKAAVRDLLRDRTCIIIAHRESTVEGVDRVIRLDGNGTEGI
jgi:ABC-type multidrug transport system fused ATPase/permease subunit